MFTHQLSQTEKKFIQKLSHTKKKFTQKLSQTKKKKFTHKLSQTEKKFTKFLKRVEKFTLSKSCKLTRTFTQSCPPMNPISKGSSPELQAIAKLITGKSPNADDSSQQMSLIHYDHKLPDRSKFVLCPGGAKKEKSSLHNLSTDTQKDFFKLLQTTGRIVPLFDIDGNRVDLLAQDTFAPWASSSLLLTRVPPAKKKLKKLRRVGHSAFLHF